MDDIKYSMKNLGLLVMAVVLGCSTAREPVSMPMNIADRVRVHPRDVTPGLASCMKESNLPENAAAQECYYILPQNFELTRKFCNGNRAVMLKGNGEYVDIFCTNDAYFSAQCVNVSDAEYASSHCAEYAPQK